MKPRLAPRLPPAQRRESWTDTSFLMVAALGGGQAAQLVRHVYSDIICELYLVIYSFAQQPFSRRFASSRMEGPVHAERFCEIQDKVA